MIRVLKWLTVGICLCLALVVALAALVVFFPPFLKMGLDAANRVLPVTIEVEQIHHLPGKLTVIDLTVSNAAGPLVKVARIRLDYSPMALLSGEVDIERLSVVNASMRCIRFPDGHLSLSGPPKVEQRREAKPSRLAALRLILSRLIVREVRIESSDFVFEDWPDNLLLHGNDLLVEGNLDGKRLEALVDALSGTLEAGTLTSAPTRMTFDVAGRVGEERLELSRMHVETDDAGLHVEGSATWNLKEISLAARLDNFPLADVLGKFGIRGVPVDRINGRISGTGKGTLDIRVETEIDTVFQGQETNVIMQGRLDGRTIMVDSLLLRQPELVFNAQGSLSLTSREVAGDFLLTSPLLKEALGPLKKSGLQMERVRVAGQIRGTLQDPLFQFGLQARRALLNGPIAEGLFLFGGYGRREGLVVVGQADKAFTFKDAKMTNMKIAGSYRDGLCLFSAGAGPAFQIEGLYQPKGNNAAVSFEFREAALLPLVRKWVPETSRFLVSGSAVFQGIPNKPETWKGMVDLSNLRIDMPDFTLSNDQPLLLRADKGLLAVHAVAKMNQSPLLLEGYVPLVKDLPMKVQGQASLSLASCRGLIRAYMPRMQDTAGRFEIKGSAQGTLDNPTVDATVRIEDGFVRITEKLSPELPEEGIPPADTFLGGFELSGHLEGPIRTPSGNLDFAVSKGTFSGIPLQTLQLAASSNGDTGWDLTARVQIPYGAVDLKGDWEPFSGKIDSTLETSQWDLTSLLSYLNIPVKGQARASGTLTGTVTSPRVDMDLKIDSVQWQGTDYGAIRADLEFVPGKLDLECRIGPNWMRVAVALDKTLATSLEGAFNRLEVGPIMQRLTGQAWDGEASFSGEVKGSLKSKNTWVGELSVPYVSMNSNGVPIFLEEPSKVIFEPGKVMFPESVFRINNDTELIYVRGIFAKDNLLSFHGATVVSPIMFLFPWFQIEQARAVGALEISGDWHNPNITGELHLVGTEFKLTDVPVVAERVDAVMKGIGKGLRFDPINVEIDEGKSEVQAQLIWEPTFILEELTARFDPVPVRLMDELMIRGKGRFTFRETLQQTSTLDADLEIVEALYSSIYRSGLDRLQSNMITLQTVLGGYDFRKWRLWQRSVFLQNMKLNARITSGPDLYLRNSMVQMVFSANMNVGGTVAEPKPVGQVKVVQGVLFYGTNKFNITQGSLVFSKDTGMIPMTSLDASVTVNRFGGEYQASRYSQRYIVYLHVEGPLDKAKLTLRSVPELSQQDIFYLLLTGKTMQEFYDSGSVGGTHTERNMAISGVSALFGADVQHYTGLDIFSISGTDDTPQGGVKATVGKQLNDRVEIRGTVFMGEGQQDPSEAAMEYQVTDWLILVGTQRVDGSFGLDIRLRFVGE